MSQIAAYFSRMRAAASALLRGFYVRELHGAEREEALRLFRS